MPTKPMNPQQRIRRAVEVSELGCWNWMLSKDKPGYGRLKIQMGSRDKYRMTSAHRYAFEIFIGHIPNGMNVLHRCDNRACCNPEHLFLGTQQDNMIDMHQKGRGPSGYKRDANVCRANSLKRFDAARAKP